jgi:hypothetical protein
MAELNKIKAITVLLYNEMQLAERKPGDFYMKALRINQRELDRPIKFLISKNLVKSHDGNKNGGLEKVVNIELENLCSMLGVPFKTKDLLISQCKEIVNETRRFHACDVCDELVPFIDRNSMCMGCAALTEPEPQLRKARCGHYSSTRYFNCIDCQPQLRDDDDLEYTIGSFERTASHD